MKTKQFKQQNRSITRKTVTRGKESTEPVHFYTNGASSVCCIKMTFTDRIRILFGENLWLIVKGGIPIFDLQTENPFAAKK